MGLPKSIRPEYNTTIPSTGKKIKYQPFSVKEEKVLVLAAESEEPDEMANAVSNILNNCITSPPDFDVSTLALFDVEYLFLKARSKSAGERIELRITDPEDETCIVDHSINIDKIKVERTEGHTDIIDIDETVKVKMKYPGLSFFVEGVQINNISDSIETVGRCISSIVVGDEVYNQEDMTEAEISEWIESLTSGQFKKLSGFFETMPKLSHSMTLKNPNTGKTFNVKLEGLADFF